MYILEFLQDKGVNYQIVEVDNLPHTSSEAAKASGLPLEMVVKTIVFTGDRQVTVSLPGHKLADVKKIKKLTGAKNLRLARPEEILALTTYQVGRVGPIFRPVEGVTKIIDTSVFACEEITIGAGELTVMLKSADLKSVWDGMVADVAK